MSENLDKILSDSVDNSKPTPKPLEKPSINRAILLYCRITQEECGGIVVRVHDKDGLTPFRVNVIAFDDTLPYPVYRFHVNHQDHNTEMPSNYTWRWYHEALKFPEEKGEEE